jgi:putative endonuclease
LSRNSGDRAEDQALAYLSSQGLTTLERNYRCRQGEIDLIMRDRESLVFVEVRYRGSNGHGSPLESVDRGKQARLLHTARHYLQCHPEHAARACRFDVVGIAGDPGRIDWVSNAFGEEW